MSEPARVSLPILSQGEAILAGVRRRLNALSLDTIVTFHFDIVQGCQLRCVGCPNSILLPKIDHITAADFAACLRNVDVRRVKVMRLFNFGEPFLHPDLGGILAAIPQQSWRVDRIEVSTNAMILDEAKLRVVLGSGVVTHLYVSCDGDGTPAEFERLRPPGKWDKLIRFLDAAARIRRELGSPVVLRTRSVCPTEAGRARWRGVLEPLGWEPEFRDWIPLPDTKEQPWDRPVNVTNRVCWPMDGVNLFVNAQAQVIPCCSYPDFEPLGDLRTQAFSAIHRGQLRREFRRALKANRVGDRICGQCEV